MDVHWWYHLFYETLQAKLPFVTVSYTPHMCWMLWEEAAETKISAMRQKMNIGDFVKCLSLEKTQHSQRDLESFQL